MNIHILQDEKFYNGMTESIIMKELVYNNVYFIVGSKQGEFEIMDPYPNCVFGGYEDLNKIDLANYDKAIFHNLGDIRSIEYLSNAGASKKKCKIYWRLWTSDNYFMVRIADIMQKSLHINHNRIYDSQEDIRTVPAYIFNTLRNLRLRRKYKERYLKYVKALSYIDYAMNWNKIEVDILEDRYSTFNAKYKSHAYRVHSKDSMLPFGGTYDLDTNDIMICVGHSGFEYVKHSKIFNIIKNIIKNEKNINFRIIAPLSYGHKDYIVKTVNEGKSSFGDMFMPITEFLEYSEYMELLNRCDVFIYGQEIPSAASNIFSAIRMGKRVILPKNNPICEIISKEGVDVFYLENLIKGDIDLLMPLHPKRATKNIEMWAIRDEKKKALNDKTLLEIIC